MKVINLYAGPGAGKSTLAAEIFWKLKKKLLNVELCTEYAKQLVYEERHNVLKLDQLYILAKQNRKMYSLFNKGVDIVVTDSPLFLNCFYNNPENFNSEVMFAVSKELYNKYENYDFFLNRNVNYGYNPNGRIQKHLEEAQQIDRQILNIMKKEIPNYMFVQYSMNTADKIIEEVLKEK